MIPARPIERRGEAATEGTVTVPALFPPSVRDLRAGETADLDGFLSAECALLILTSATSLYSEPLTAGVERLARSGYLDGIATGILPIDSPAADTFLASNPWIEDDQTYPYVIYYRRGLRVEGFTAFSASYLLERLDRLELLPATSEDFSDQIAA